MRNCSGLTFSKKIYVFVKPAYDLLWSRLKISLIDLLVIVMEPEHMDFEGGAGQGGHLEKKLLRCRLFVAISPLLPSCVLRRVAHLRRMFL